MLKKFAPLNIFMETEIHFVSGLFDEFVLYICFTVTIDQFTTYSQKKNEKIIF